MLYFNLQEETIMKFGKWNLGIKGILIGGAAVIVGILLGKGGTTMIEDNLTKADPDSEDNDPNNSDDEEIKEAEANEEAEEPAPDPEVLDKDGEIVSPD